MVVHFSPEDLRLIKAGPAERRRFMDMEICQLSPVYYSDLRDYTRALKQRNQLLKVLRKDRSFGLLDTLFVWDEQLRFSGCRIMKTRSTFIKKINEYAREIHSQITNASENLEMIYQPNILNPELYKKAMQDSHEKDIALGITTIGPHKDDILFTINEIPARSFGSQGQQRTAALSAKLAEIEIISNSTNTSPVLLLDDVLSELDGNRQKYLLTQINKIQTIITCTGLEDVLLKNTTQYKIMRVKNGKIISQL